MGNRKEIKQQLLKIQKEEQKKNAGIRGKRTGRKA